MKFLFFILIFSYAIVLVKIALSASIFFLSMILYKMKVMSNDIMEDNL